MNINDVEAITFAAHEQHHQEHQEQQQRCNDAAIASFGQANLMQQFENVGQLLQHHQQQQQQQHEQQQSFAANAATTAVIEQGTIQHAIAAAAAAGQPTHQTVFHANPAMVAMQQAIPAQYMLTGGNQIGTAGAIMQTAVGPQMLVPTQQIATVSPMNQLVQVLLGNGQMMTTTMANIQAMGLNNMMALPQTQQTMVTPFQTFPTAFQPVTNTYQTQLVTNAAGQVFALTPQNAIIQATPVQPAMIAAQQAASTQFVQMAGNPMQVIQTIAPNLQQVATVQSQSATNIATAAASTGVVNSENEATRLHVQQIIQQQQQILEQQQQNRTFISRTLSTTRTTTTSNVQNNRDQQQTQIEERTITTPDVQCDANDGDEGDYDDDDDDDDSDRLSINEDDIEEIESSTTPQPTVSSTTYITTNYGVRNKSTNELNQLPSQSSNADHISVQSQTSSPASTTGSCTMEPESTTQNNLNPQITISNTDASIVDGVNLEEIKEFARQFKLRRISLGLTQTQVGQALSATEGPSYSQSAICRFEKLDITPKSAQKIKPVLEKWMEEAEERCRTGTNNFYDLIGNDQNKKRKRRTSFTPGALDILNHFFEKNTHPSGSEMTELAERLNYDREVVRVWFCNKRQALRNTIKRLEPTAPTTTTVILA